MRCTLRFTVFLWVFEVVRLETKCLKWDLENAMTKKDRVYGFKVNEQIY